MESKAKTKPTTKREATRSPTPKKVAIIEISKEELIVKASTAIGSNLGPVYERQNEYEQIVKFIKTSINLEQWILMKVPLYIFADSQAQGRLQQ